jgi:hypothetical protein
MLRDSEPRPSHVAARKLATVRATPEHFKVHEARCKHGIKVHSRRAVNEQQGEADDTAGVREDGSNASRRASTTFDSGGPQPSTPTMATSAPYYFIGPTRGMVLHKPTIKQPVELLHVVKEQYMTLHLGCEYLATCSTTS